MLNNLTFQKAVTGVTDTTVPTDPTDPTDPNGTGTGA